MEFFKKTLYFPFAWYFRFFAQIRLSKWHPRIIVITGSVGKTTLLHLIESQLGNNVRYARHANSSFGIPFDILGLHRKTLQKSEWIGLFLKAPLYAFKNPPKDKIYLIEADCDRPHEGKFLGGFLKPEVVLWVSTGRTHSLNFDRMPFKTVDEAIAYEFGYFLAYCQKVAMINGDSSLQKQQIKRTCAEIISVSVNDCSSYSVKKEGTQFSFPANRLHNISVPGLLPKEASVSVQMCRELVSYLGFSFDPSFAHFVMPPGRGRFFPGIKKTMLVDCSYNASLSSMKSTLSMFENISAKKKWVVLGDMLELGKEEKEEHEALGKVLQKMKLDKVILVGKLVGEYTFPLVNQSEKFATATEAGEYLFKNITGGEVILFKGSQSIYLEGIIEKLLQNKKDADKLPRRGMFWKGKRA